MTQHLLPSGIGSPAVLAPETSEGERSEPERGAGASTAARAGRPGPLPSVEVRTKRGRRTFTAEYKARILHLADVAKGAGAIGALLRRESLYSSHLVQWRKLRDQAQGQALAVRKRGPKGKSQETKHVEALVRENAKLLEELRKAKTIIEYQKKVHALLGIPLPEVPHVGER